MRYFILFVLSFLLFTACAIEAQSKEKTGKEITDLLEEGIIEVETQGNGIENVELRIRRKVDYPVTVVVPVGSMFVPENSGSQNMVSTSEKRYTLKNKSWITISVPAACANRPLDIPGEGDKFEIYSSPNQDELKMLMPVLSKAGVGFEVKQAAVWIITDDADYYDLGTLERGYGYGYGGSRAINEAETFTALKLIAKAGIDIRYKKIWSDRQTIKDGLNKAKKNEFERWEAGLN